MESLEGLKYLKTVEIFEYLSVSVHFYSAVSVFTSAVVNALPSKIPKENLLRNEESNQTKSQRRILAELLQAHPTHIQPQLPLLLILCCTASLEPLSSGNTVKELDGSNSGGWNTLLRGL